MKERYEVLDHGYVAVIDQMGDDASIVAAARDSYDPTSPRVREDADLIDHLLKNGHTSPFEMVEFKFHVKCPIFVARQWVRHRTANINERSLRYSKAHEECYIPMVARGQASRKGQEMPAVAHDAIARGRFERAYAAAFSAYNKLLRDGVDRELARAVLPLATYTSFTWKIDAHNLMRFLTLRCDKHAQWEIRQYAMIMAEIFDARLPATANSWRKHAAPEYMRLPNCAE